MQEDEFIIFEKMPIPGETFPGQQIKVDDTIYVSLFDEIETKCNPDFLSILTTACLMRPPASTAN